MKTLVKKHEEPQFEVIVNQENGNRFFVASGAPTSEAKGIHVNSWDNAW